MRLMRLKMRLIKSRLMRLKMRLMRLNLPATESEYYERASSLEQGCRQVLESEHLGVSGGYLGVRKPASFEKSFPSKR